MRIESFLLVFVSLFLMCCSSPVKDGTEAAGVKDETVCIKDIDNAAINNVNTKTLCTGFYYVVDSVNDFKYQLDKSAETYYLDPAPILIKSNILSTEIYSTEFEEATENYTGLGIKFDDYGTKKWADATQKATLKRIALIIDNKLVIASIVNGQITGGVAAINRTEYTLADIEGFKKQLD